MRETSVGLGIIQIVTMIVVAAFLIRLALAVVTVVLVIWIIYHFTSTIGHRPKPHLAPNAVYVGGDSTSYAGQTNVSARETTNWLGLVSAALAVTASIPLLLGHANWVTGAFGATAVICAVIAGRRSGSTSRVTAIGLLGTIVVGALLTIFGLLSIWMNASTTLYGNSWGDEFGSVATIAELQQALPCIDESKPAATGVPGAYSFDPAVFAATVSCQLVEGEEAYPAVFVQARSAAGLDDIFAAGVLSVNGSRVSDLWVARDGAVAVITLDEESESLAENATRTWISLRDEPR